MILFGKFLRHCWCLIMKTLLDFKLKNYYFLNTFTRYFGSFFLRNVLCVAWLCVPSVITSLLWWGKGARNTPRDICIQLDCILLFYFTKQLIFIKLKCKINRILKFFEVLQCCAWIVQHFRWLDLTCYNLFRVKSACVAHTSIGDTRSICWVIVVF